MDALTLIRQARAAGLDLRVEGDRLVVRGPRSAEPIVAVLREHRAELLALVTAEAAEVAWRVTAMLSQVPKHGAIGFLFARSGLADAWCDLGLHQCHSCGNALPVGYLVGIAPRCTWCQKAAEQACNTVREGVSGEE